MSDIPDSIEPLVTSLLKEIGEDPGRDGLPGLEVQIDVVQVLVRRDPAVLAIRESHPGAACAL